MARLRAGHWPGWRWSAAAFGLGVVMATGQAPVGAWMLAVPALAGLLGLILAQPRRGAAVWLALFGGAGHFAAALNWIVEPFFIDVARHGWMAPFAVVLMAFGLALFWAGAAAVAGRSALGLAVALAAAELARGYVLTGFPWALIGHIWIDAPPGQVAALVGPSGLTLMTTLAAAGLAVAVGSGPASGGRRWAGAVAAVTLIAAGWGYGASRLAQPDPASPGLVFRLAQPNAEQAAKWDPDKARLWFDRLLAYTAVQPAPNLVIWPETALPYLLERHPEIVGMMVQAAQGAPVAFGRQRVVAEQGWNSLTVIGSGGAVLAEYDKHHLVPFGEYMPFGDFLYRWFGISAFASQVGNGYSAGPGPAVLDLGRLGKVLPLICYEAVFPQDLRGAGRPDWLLQITNDAWFGTLTGPFQHLAQARLRAIEQGLPLVRVANTGVTAMIDARGHVVDALPFGTAGYLDAALPGPLPATLYARWSEGPVLVLLAMLAMLAAGLHRGKGMGRGPRLDAPPQSD